MSDLTQQQTQTTNDGTSNSLPKAKRRGRPPKASTTDTELPAQLETHQTSADDPLPPRVETSDVSDEDIMPKAAKAKPVPQPEPEEEPEQVPQAAEVRYPTHNEIGFFESQVVMAFREMPEGERWIEAPQHVIDYYNKNGLGKARYFTYKGVNVAPEGQLDEILDEMAIPMEKRLHGKEGLSRVVKHTFRPGREPLVRVPQSQVRRA